MSLTLSKFEQSQKGFTLIELMVTVAIVGILATVALPSYIDTVRETRRSDAYDALLECAAAQARAYTTSAQPSYLSEAQATNAGICNDSKEGFYTIAVTNPSCSNTVGGATLNWCFTATATALAGQLNDECRNLTIDHTGRKAATDSANNDNTDECWRS